MMVKTIVGWTEGGFDEKINNFLSNPSIEVISFHFSSPILIYSVSIVYKEVKMKV